MSQMKKYVIKNMEGEIVEEIEFAIEKEYYVCYFMLQRIGEIAAQQNRTIKDYKWK